MASLALIVGLMFLGVMLAGPICYILSRIPMMPKSLIVLMGFLTIFIGVWWLLLPIGPVRYIGLLTALLGFQSMRSKVFGA